MTTEPDASASTSSFRTDEVFPEVYEELRRLARARLREIRPGQTLQTTALVHEAYVRLVKSGDARWKGRAHFFGAAARAMRLILVDYARRRSRLKRGGDRVRLGLTVDLEDRSDESHEGVERLGEVIGRLEALDARKAELASLHLLVGMTHEQIAEAMELSVRTVEREWRFSRAWLQRELDIAAPGRSP
ncbi:MAG: sigma-70 family RNA polymerase sigma factor [Phycisphaerales bacterium]|nr:sigma-70 family RNA polymerase sigma factor [Phycisphaerales bacterium]